MKLSITVFLLCAVAFGQSGTAIPPGAKVYIVPMHNFETYLAAAFAKKKVPVTVVSARNQADFDITGTAKSERNGLWREVLLWQGGSKEDASIQVTNAKTGVVAFAYSYHKTSSRRQSAAESCAKHLKKKIEKAK